MVLYFETQAGADDCEKQLAEAGLRFSVDNDPRKYGDPPAIFDELVPLVLIFPTLEEKDAFIAICLAANPQLSKQCLY